MQRYVLIFMFCISNLLLVSCALQTKQPSGKVFVFGDDREQVVIELRKLGIRAEVVDYWSLERDTPLFVQGKYFFDEDTIDKISKLIDIEIKQVHSKNHTYRYHSGLYLPAKEEPTRGFAGNCKDFIDFTIMRNKILIVRSTFDENNYSYTDEMAIEGRLVIDNGVMQMLVDDKLFLELRIEKSPYTDGSILKVLPNHDDLFQACIFREKSAWPGRPPESVQR